MIVWAWGALVAAIVLGILAALGFMRGRKPEEAPELAIEERKDDGMPHPQNAEP